MSYQYWPEISFYLKEIERERLFLAIKPSTEQVELTRKNIKDLLDVLKTNLEQTLQKQNTSLILFAIVALVDEEMQRCLFENGRLTWPPLQKDFYGAYNAGEIFYKTIDDIIDEPNTPTIVYEVYYFILKSGFKGKHRDSKTQIAKHLDLLRDKIPLITTSKDQNDVQRRGVKKPRVKKTHYYLIAASLVVGVFYMLRYLSEAPL